jgi:PBP1b-binding outer membrane lipoprotein LpoB
MYRYGVGLALVALVAAGCTKEHAGTLPSLSPSPTSTATSASPTSSATTPAQQIATAARAYFTALEKAGKTGDVNALSALLSTTCDCRQQVTAISTDAQAGRHVTTSYQVESVGPHNVGAAAGSATVTYSSPASRLVDSTGRTIQTFAARTHAGVDLTFRRVGGAWLLDGLVRLGA